ncbi:MAG: DUF799 domain-containing protein [Candidatus Hydrogenedentes bacterium]|nr:DUF799 domain-containing protein [Candidatus Hydrogenedentota bacterium]
MKRHITAIGFAGLALLAGLSGCGYSTESSLDPQYQSIFVPAFKNMSREYDLQAPLTNAVIRKFIADGRLHVTDEQDADLILEGVILGYNLKGFTYDEDDEVTNYLVEVSAGARLIDRKTGNTLWVEPRISGNTSYYTRASGQSSDRLRGNADTFVPTVRSFSTEEENRSASEALERLASAIFYRTVEPW